MEEFPTRRIQGIFVLLEIKGPLSRKQEDERKDRKVLRSHGGLPILPHPVQKEFQNPGRWLSNLGSVNCRQ